MNEERRMILQMLKDGAISVEEAERLMEAVPAGEEDTKTANALTASSGMPKRISVLVTGDGKTKVNVKVPFSLVRAGLKLGKTFGVYGAKFTKDPSEAEMLESLKSLDVDEILNSINDGDITLPYTMVDVEDDEKGEHVKVVLE